MSAAKSTLKMASRSFGGKEISELGLMLTPGDGEATMENVLDLHVLRGCRA